MSAPPRRRMPPGAKPRSPDQRNSTQHVDGNTRIYDMLPPLSVATLQQEPRGPGSRERHFGGHPTDSGRIQPLHAGSQGLQINNRLLTPNSQELSEDSEDAAPRKNVDVRKLPPKKYKKVIGPGVRAKTEEEKEQRDGERTNRNRKSAAKSRQKKKREEEQKAAELVAMQWELVQLQQENEIYRAHFGPPPRRGVAEVTPPTPPNENSSEQTRGNPNFDGFLSFGAIEPLERNSSLANDPAMQQDGWIGQLADSGYGGHSCLLCREQRHHCSLKYRSYGYLGPCDRCLNARLQCRIAESDYPRVELPADFPGRFVPGSGLRTQIDADDQDTMSLPASDSRIATNSKFGEQGSANARSAQNASQIQTATSGQPVVNTPSSSPASTGTESSVDNGITAHAQPGPLPHSRYTPPETPADDLHD